MRIERTFTVYACLREHINEGFVHFRAPYLESRCIVRISRKGAGGGVYCEALQLDDNYVAEYDGGRRRRKIGGDVGGVITMGDWYRKKLGVKKNSQVPFVICPCNGLWGKFWACMDHPQVVVRLSTCLGAIGLVLGVVGFAISIMQVFCGRS